MKTKIMSLLFAMSIIFVACDQTKKDSKTSTEAKPATVEVQKMEMTTPIPESISTPDVVETSIGTMNYFDGVPTQETVDASFDFLDKANAYKAFLSTLPTVSVNELRVGQASMGAKSSNQICIFDELMDSKSLVLTGNTSTMYALGFLDLKKDGPTVIELP